MFDEPSEGGRNTLRFRNDNSSNPEIYFDPGKYVFDPPSNMEQGKTERVELRITPNLSEDITQGLKGLGPPQGGDIKIGWAMKADLSGDPDTWKIALLNATPEQVVEGSPLPYTEWDWDVTPKQSGIQRLDLSIAIIASTGSDFKRTYYYSLKDVTISVKVNKVSNYWMNISYIIKLAGS
jgi:hypothetical protein